MTGYEAAKAKYEALGVDTDRAIERLKRFQYRCTAGSWTM